MLCSVIKSILIKIRYGKKINFKIYKHLSFFSNVEIDKKSFILSGKGLFLSKNSWLIAHNGGNLKIGNNVSLNRNSICCCHEEIIIGDNTSIGPNVCIYDHDHKFGINGKTDGFNSSKILIGKNVWIGSNCVILRGITIGDNSVIGAGCVVRRNIPPNSLVTNDETIIIKELR